MSQLHICNTFFERELTAPPRPLSAWLRSHPIILQLQFLPLIYAKKDDLIAVSALPPDPDPRLIPIDYAPRDLPLSCWGPSQAINHWVKTAPHPNWKQIVQMNSKIFSFENSPKLPHSKLLLTKEEITDWIQTTPGPKVLKTPFGTAGNGHTLNPDVQQLYKPPLIGEPWVERICDFSTQWDRGKLIGVTLFENEPNGTYRGTFAGEPAPWALNEHIAHAEPLVKKICQMGYHDNIGIDAFIYKWEGKPHLHPIVEINARKTMSWVALQTPAKQLFYTHTPSGLLPSTLQNNGKTIQFTRNINLN